MWPRGWRVTANGLLCAVGVRDAGSARRASSERTRPGRDGCRMTELRGCGGRRDPCGPRYGRGSHLDLFERKRRKKKMLGMKRITIAQHERGLLFRNRSFVAVLEPGVRWIFDPLRRTDVQVCDLTVPEFEHPRVDFLLEAAGTAM